MIRANSEAEEKAKRLARLESFLGELCRLRGLSLAELSESLFGDKFKLYNITQKGREPNLSTLHVLHKAGLNADWLISGEGEMMRARRG